MADNKSSVQQQAADRARQGAPAPVYKPSTPSTLREAGTAAYNAQVRSQSSGGKK